jgi:transposase-like protein
MGKHKSGNNFGRPKGGVNNTYTPEFKLEIIKFNKEHGPKETERVYGVVNTVFYKWERVYLEEGIDGLSVERRGRRKNQEDGLKGRPIKLDAKVEEDLIAENQRLRMENDYLKKLAALIQEEGKKQKKSK